VDRVRAVAAAVVAVSSSRTMVEVLYLRCVVFESGGVRCISFFV